MLYSLCISNGVEPSGGIGVEELKRLVIPLLAWYNENKRDLPWRRPGPAGRPEPYHVWVSEIMLQQTRVAAVLGYYQRFLERFSTLADLAAAPEDELMKCWQGLGYYSRARNLQRAAQVIVHDYGGAFPSDYEAIRALPGVGDYTAGAISSIAFGLPRAAVDGNVLRVVTRLTADGRDISSPAVKKSVAAALEAVMPLKAPGEFDQALMELGATVCLPNGAPLCGRCPAQDFCRAHVQDRTADFPVKPSKKPRRSEQRQVYLLFHRGRVALRRRPDKGLLAGLWEFPNALEGEALPLDLPPLEFVGTAKHIFTHIEWHMTGWAGELRSDRLPEGWVWANAFELRHTYSIPSALRAFTEIAEKGLK